ncbi:SDR family oxidoreductase [Actinomadura graeca]|uniref:SDR family oxidoreductase n=1 Tax=Actinomadura graeca TaxID=2750812 RepID=A0ABX8QX99_9ACTN|nr:SDR family oxidoreductase [Actinomadura graeca]QXJ23390.1 SDR family oxidoreductase [Actinomadura graeca]
MNPPSSRNLTGKVALVTGGAKNVGRAIATTLADHGAHVLINYFHSHEQAKETREELRRRGARVDLLRASVARPEQVARMFDEIEARFGRLDILVNNAAGGALVPASEVTDADLDRALDTNLKGGLRCARAAARLMARNGGGSIVTVSALGGSQLVMADYLACAPAKAAAEAVTRYLAVEFAPHNIRVNTASAAMLVSEVADAFPGGAAMQAAVAAATPLGRLGTPEEFAEVVAFLASDQASWITGQVVLADGGLTLGAPLLSPPGPPGPPGPPAPSASAGPAGQDAVAVEGATSGADPVRDGDDQIAVVGMGLAVSGADGPEAFWELRTSGRELFVEVPEERWDRTGFSSGDVTAEDKSYQDTCVFITGFQPDGAALEGLPTSADETEFTTLWLRHSLVQALTGVRRTGRDRFSFNVGYTADGSQHLEEAGVLATTRRLTREILAEMDVGGPRRDQLLDEVDRVLSGRYHRAAVPFPHFLPHEVGHQAMAGVLPADTQVQMVDTACSSSLYAVDIGVKGLLAGRQDIAVCGGAFALAPRGTVLFSKLKGLSERGAVHALDAKADGVIFADGAGVVVLKRLSRARADGDRVLAVLKGFGSSSDGRGKAIYAPSPAGQDLAVRRALGAGGVSGADVGWVNAHATGTPTGDLAEFTTLRRHFGTEGPAVVTSNKSLIGHTGWAAGVVSLIESILGMREATIPGQYRFTSAPAEFALDTTRLEISGAARPWPSEPGRPRTAAISGFGFGGTNAHLIVAEPPTEDRGTGEHGGAAPRPPGRGSDGPGHTGRIAVVGWSARLPGAGTDDDVVRRLTGDGRVSRGFGDTYPPPPFQQVRMPPATVRTIDRCQLMILACGHDLRDRLPGFWSEHAERTGVVIGHMGPTRAAMQYAARCYLDDIGNALRGDAGTGSVPELEELLDRLRERVRSMTPPSNEDSFPGMMPNIIAARVANHFDLKGLNITVDAGLASTQSAFAIAGRYLLGGELDLVLAGGINGNSLPEYRDLLTGVFAGRPVDLAEGAFLFGLTTERTARDAGLPVLALVEETGPARLPGPGAADRVVDSGADGRYSGYLGASGAAEILRALHADPGVTEIRCREDARDAATRLLVTVGVGGGTAPASNPRAAHAEIAAPAHRADAHPAGVAASRVASSGVAANVVERFTAGLEPAGVPSAQGLRPVAAVPDDAVVLTDRPELAGPFGRSSGTTVLSTTAPSGPLPGVHHVGDDDDLVRRAVEALPRPLRHVVVLADLSASSPASGALTDDAPSLTALHDLAFLVCQERYEELGGAGASVVFALLGARPGGTPHPMAGLFTGLAKCVNLELADAECFALVMATRDPREAAALVAGERGADRPFPVVHHDGTQRLVPALTRSPARSRGAGAAAPLDRDAVVVALGGGRGITAELLTALSARFQSRIHVLGSNPLDEHPPETYAGTDAEFAATRAAFISGGLAAGGATVAGLSRRFDRLVDARTTRRNLARMAEHSGEGRVTYLTCDARDEKSVRAAIEAVLDEHGAIDLLINAPGLNRSALIRDKDVAEFRAIRDLKVNAHRNLRRALADRPPRLWCDFGSLLGYFGQRGEADYASGNDYLAMAADYAAAMGTDEFVIGWTLWDEVGMGAGELTRDYFKRTGSYSHMPVAEGIRHFLDELAPSTRATSVVHLGAAERATVERFYPGYLDSSATGSGVGPPAPPAEPGRFYLRRPLAPAHGPRGAGDADNGEIRFECRFDLDGDGYLEHHLVRGVPTLPGTFVTEIAAEAALALIPGAKVLAFEDVRFLRFLQVRPGAEPDPKRITARVARRVGELTTVDVEVTHDVRAPSGVLLVRDRPHFTARVVLGPRFPTSPHWEPWDEVGERAVPDPYHLRSSPVRLSGPFEATADTRRHPKGARSTFRPRLDATGPWSAFRMPVVLLDAMARTGVLDPAGGRVPIAAPLAIRRIDLYQEANDLRLAADHDHVALYVVDPGFSGTGAGGNRFVATTPDGRILAQMKDLEAVPIGYLDTATLEVLPPGDGGPADAPAGPRERRVPT